MFLAIPLEIFRNLSKKFLYESKEAEFDTVDAFYLHFLRSSNGNNSDVRFKRITLYIRSVLRFYVTTT